MQNSTEFDGDRSSSDVARFYEQLVFPSRSSHPTYARLLPGETGLRIADLGCGQSLFYDALRHYEPPPTFLDISMNALRTLNYGFRVRGDLRHIPILDEVYDRVYCIGVLHHLRNRDSILREITRILRPGGSFAMGVYAPRTLQAFLRKLYDQSSARPWRRLVFETTRCLIRARYGSAGRKLQPTDVRMRVRDFLDVPYVEYTDPDVYTSEVESSGLLRQGLRRIGAMNILFFRKP